MKKYLLTIAVLAMALGLFPSKVRASDDPDSNKWKITTVRWVQEHQDQLDDSDKHVVLIGKVISVDGEDNYILDDGTGTIFIDSDDTLPVGKTVVVRGDVDQAYWNIGELELNVKSWRLDKR